MELSDAYVFELADRTRGFAVNRNHAQAEAHVAARMAETRAKFTQDGIDLVSPEALERLEDQARRQWDEETGKEGTALELELATTAAIVADRIEASKVLAATVEPLVTRQERQTEELISLLTEDRFRARFERQTRQDVLDAYARADETTQAGRRLVVFLEAHWSTLTFKDDPQNDVMTIPQVGAAFEARRQKRVPSQLLDWRERLQLAWNSVGFTNTLQHLRSGKGIARRPKPLKVAI